MAKSTSPLAIVLVSLLFLGTLPIAQLVSASNTAVVDTDTNTVYFDEVIYHESEQPLFASDKTLFTVPAMGRTDYALCTGIQAAQLITSGSYFWNCDDLDGDGWFALDTDGHFLEHDRYSANIYLVYQYKIEYSGDLTFETTTTWDYNTQPYTSTKLIDSNENFIVSAKASLRLKIDRDYVGPNGNQNINRNTLDFDIPVVNPFNDIDGDGSSVSFKGTTFYLWDSYVEFASEYNENDMLGTNHDLDGAITLYEVDILGLAGKILTGSALQILKAFSYFISVTFEINLDLEVDMRNYVQVLLGMNSVSSIRSTYNSDSARSGYACFMGSSSTTNTCDKMVTGSGSQMNGVLGFYHTISTKESYSANIVVDHSDSDTAQEIWGWFTNGQPKTYPISSGHYTTRSTENHLTLSSSSFAVDSTNSYIMTTPPNNRPEITITDGSEEIANIFTNTGIQNSITIYTYDADGDSLTGSVSWGDGTYTTLNSNSPQSLTHTYTDTGIYHIGVEVSDGKDFSYGDSLKVIVTPQSSAVSDLSISVPDILIDEGDSMSFTLDSTSSISTTEYVFDDAQGNEEMIQPSTGNLQSLTRNIQYQSPGEYYPSLRAYDSNGNLIGYETIKIRVLPDFGNGTYDITQFEILGDGILVVIDDDGSQLYTDERTEHYENSNISSISLINAVSKVATIRDKSVEFFIVGDTDLDGAVDTFGSNGPGLRILSQYSTVIWTTGSDPTPLTDFDEAVLRTYVRSNGALIMFSQDYLWGVNSSQNTWYPGSFAYDILGVSSSEQEIGEPGGNFISNNEPPFFGLGEVELSELTNYSFQDHLSNEETSYFWPEFQDFESSSVHGVKSRYVNPQTSPWTDMGQGTINWRTWSYWQRDCSASTSGSCSLKSAPANNNNAKLMYADVPTLNVPTQIQFNYFVSSEANYDILKFSVNGQEIQRWSGTSMTQWGTFTHTLSAGSHQLEWAYVKDASGSAGSDAAWIDAVYICCNTQTVERPTVTEIMPIGESNYGLMNRALTDADNDGTPDTVTDVFFFSIDPVQIDKKYDLESMFINLLDTSVNRNPIPWTPEGGIETRAKANWLFMDDSRLLASNWGGQHQIGEQWYKMRLFDGQNIQINFGLTSSSSDVYNNYDIADLRLYDIDDNPIIGSIISSDEWVLNYTAPATGTYYLKVDLSLTGSNQSSSGSILPFYTLVATTKSDDFTSDLQLNGVAISDSLTPRNWAGAEDYSSTIFNLGTLQGNSPYGINLDQIDEFGSNSLQYTIYDSDSYQIYESNTFNLTSTKRHSILFELQSSANVSFMIEHIGNYEHPLLGTFGYEIDFWGIPGPDITEQSSGIYKLSENTPQNLWISSSLDQSDTFTVDSSWDEKMIVEFETESSNFDAYATVQCPNQQAITQSLYDGIIEVECIEPFSEAIIEIFTNDIFLPYSIIYVNKNNDNLAEMNKPMFGLNQNSGSSDVWILPYISDGRLLVIETEETGSVSFFDRMNSLIVSEMTTSEIMFVPENAYRIKVQTTGEYQFLLFEPNDLEITLEYPQIITIGEIIQMNVSITNSFDFISKMSQERFAHMWDIEYPNLELYISQNQNSIQLIDQQTVNYSTSGVVNNEIRSSFSIDSGQLEIGSNLVSFDYSSDWHGEFELHVEIDVFDKINTIPEISGPTYLEFNQSNGSAFWTYEVSDLDGDVLTVSLAQPVDGLEIGPTSIDSTGTLGVNWAFADLEDENYEITIIIEDDESLIEYNTVLKLIFETITPADVYGCLDVNALNYNEMATVDDGSCQFEEVIENETNQTVDDDIDDANNLTEDDNDKSGDESKADSADDNTMMYSIFGIIAFLLLCVVLISLRVSRSKRIDQPNIFEEQNLVEDLSYLNQFQPSTSIQSHSAEFVAPISQVQPVQAPTVQANNGPTRVESYMQLTGGGQYSTDQRGVVYTDPSGVEWVQLGDGSFVRIN